MKYRHYVLHPDLDSYFSSNYNKFKITQLAKYKYIFESNEINNYPSNMNKIYNYDEPHYPKDDFPIFLNIDIDVLCTWAINTDIFIKLGNIPPQVICNISIHLLGTNIYMGATKSEIYKMEWLTIFMYNTAYYPELVADNVFILPNALLINHDYQDIAITYRITIQTLTQSIFKYCFDPWMRNIFDKSYLSSDLIELTKKYMVFELILDIWHRVSNFTEFKLHNYDPRPIQRLYHSYRTIYMHKHTCKINQTIYKGKICGIANFTLHKNLLHTRLLFTIFAINSDKGTWDILDGFAYCVITYKNHHISTLYKHDLKYEKIIIKNHISGQPIYMEPFKYNITSIITDECKHPYMYYIDFSNAIQTQIAMSDDTEYDNDEKINILFNIDLLKNNPDNIYIYIETSTR